MGRNSIGKASDRHAADAGSIPRCGKGFSPTVNFQCRLSCGVRAPPCAIACINICAHVKDLVVHVRVRWITETLKHPACTIGWAARFCRSRISLGKVARMSDGRYLNRNNIVVQQQQQTLYIYILTARNRTCSVPITSPSLYMLMMYRIGKERHVIYRI